MSAMSGQSWEAAVQWDDSFTCLIGKPDAAFLTNLLLWQVSSAKG
jgi:hypothetical protein